MTTTSQIAQELEKGRLDDGHRELGVQLWPSASNLWMKIVFQEANNWNAGEITTLVIATLSHCTGFAMELAYKALLATERPTIDTHDLRRVHNALCPTTRKEIEDFVEDVPFFLDTLTEYYNTQDLKYITVKAKSVSAIRWHHTYMDRGSTSILSLYGADRIRQFILRLVEEKKPAFEKEMKVNLQRRHDQGKVIGWQE